MQPAKNIFFVASWQTKQTIIRWSVLFFGGSGIEDLNPCAQNGPSRPPVPTIKLIMRSLPISRKALQSPRFYAILITGRRWGYEKELQLLGNPSKHSAIQIKADFTYPFKRLPCYKFDCICNFITRNTPLDTWSCFLFSCIYFSSIVWQKKRSMGLVGYHPWHSAFACHFRLLYPFVWPISILCRHSGTSYHFNSYLWHT